MSTTSALSLTGVTRSFGGVVAVHQVDLDLPPGSRRALLGPNGAGKTTLVNLVAGDLRPDDGTVSLFGVDVTHESGRRRVSRGLGRTYQRSRTFPGLTAEGDVDSHSWEPSEARGACAARATGAPRGALRPSSLLARVGLAGRADSTSGTLSHGEHRQLELAMGLAGDPRLLILDEPAAGLSPSEREVLTGLLLGLDPGLTVLLIEHDMNIALTVADTVTVMADCHVVFAGTPAEIRRAPRSTTSTWEQRACLRSSHPDRSRRLARQGTRRPGAPSHLHRGTPCRGRPHAWARPRSARRSRACSR